MWFWLITVIILIGVGLFLYFYKRPADTLNMGPYELSGKPTVGNTIESRTILTNSDTGTFQAFVYPMPLQRTGKLRMCNTNKLGKPGEPNCSTGRYNLCACPANDCSQCKHTGYVNVLNMSNIVRIELLAVPDAARQNASAAQIVVRTRRTKKNSSDTEALEETMVLPEIPYQKWTMITVAREGRRFDVYYNAQLVFSKRTQYMLDTSAATEGIVAGDPDLYGQIAYVQTFPEKLTASQISLKYSANADTNGRPYLDDIKIPPILPICKDGSCIRGPNVRPASPLKDWDTEYA